MENKKVKVNGVWYSTAPETNNCIGCVFNPLGKDILVCLRRHEMLTTIQTLMKHLQPCDDSDSPCIFIEVPVASLKSDLKDCDKAMTDRFILDYLQKNEKTFAELVEAQQVALIYADIKNVTFKDWDGTWIKKHHAQFKDGAVYRISIPIKELPKTVEVEITRNGSELLICQNNDGVLIYISDLANHPDFIGFKYPNDTRTFATPVLLDTKTKLRVLPTHAVFIAE